MRRASQGVAVALGAIREVLNGLSRVPHSDERQRLTGEARACERIVRSWDLLAPKVEDREAVMKRVLALHIATTKLRAE
jgi:hypothetical protein